MSLINITNLTFGYEGSFDNVFEDVSFAIDSDWRLGFVGRNGRGKTTFLQLLLHSSTPMPPFEYSGNIHHNVSFEYFPYNNFDKTLPTLSVVLHIVPNSQNWEIERELNLLQVPQDSFYRPFHSLSQGEQTKVLLVALFLKENNFLLIDEPTNHLDSEARSIVSRYLASKSGFILVCHDRQFLDACTDHTLSINKTDIEIQKGSFSSWHQNKQAKEAFEKAQNKKLRMDISRLEVAARQSSDWSSSLEKTKYNTKNSGLRPDRGAIGAQAARMMKKAKSIEKRQNKAIAEKSTLLKNTEEIESLKLSSLVYHSDSLVHCKDIAILYGDNKVCKNLTFDIKRGDKICLSGKNGSGKSSLIKLILGENISHTGDFEKGSGIKISYVSQSDNHLQGSLKSFTIKNSIDESLFKAILRKLGFDRPQLEKNMENFSAGQRKKVQLAKSLCEKAHLYIWDEPLNFVDILSRIQLEELLSTCPITLVFVEHDQMFKEKVATKTVHL